MWEYISADELYHHGVKGMRWGVRRYQNENGSLTSAGRKRQQKRDEYLRREQELLKSNREQAELNKKLADDLSKHGWNAKVPSDFVELRGEWRPKNYKEYYEWAADEKLSGYSKAERKAALKTEISTYRNEQKFFESRVKEGQKAIDNIKNTPIYKKSVAEVSGSYNRAAGAAAIAAAVAVMGANKALRSKFTGERGPGRGGVLAGVLAAGLTGAYISSLGQAKVDSMTK